MATIKELAKCCGVSVATVSNILNNKPGASDKTRKLVLEMAEKLDYTPNVVAKNLKLQKTRSIGVIAEDMTIFSIPDVIDGITDYCQELDYQILLTNLRLFKKYDDTYYNRDDYYGQVGLEIKKLMEKQVEGIIYVAAHEPVAEFNTLVNPGTHIPAGATNVNGITDDMVRAAPGLKEVLPEFLSFIEGEILVGHNIQSFDLLFLYRAAEELLRREVANDYVDTLFMGSLLFLQCLIPVRMEFPL